MNQRINDLTSLYVGRNTGFNPNLVFLHTEIQRKTSTGEQWFNIFVLQGGTRSGKTYSEIDFIIWLIENYTGFTISVVRATLPSIRATNLRDFQDRMIEAGLWSDKNFNKSNFEYKHNGNLVEFFSVDNEQKVRGRKRQVLICAEANEISKDKMMQLLFRTEMFTIFDYNPSMVSGYIYDDILTRPQTALLITTYKDNPHLSPNIIAEIERLKETDPELWKVYGCGQRGENRKGQIYTNWSKSAFRNDLPMWYGVDFGFSIDPTSIVRIAYDQLTSSIYLHEVCYQKGLQNSDIARIIKQDWSELRVDADVKMIPIYCDSAEPKSISEIRFYGLSTYPCIKGNGSIVSQIQFVKNFSVYYSHESRNIAHEVDNYKWLQRPKSQKEFENIPMAGFDHAMDAIRYGCYSHLSKNFKTFASISKIKNQDAE